MAEKKSKTHFTLEELNDLWNYTKSRFWDGIRSDTGLIYVAATVLGVGWATWGIPLINGSETSPETLGIYVIGILFTVLLDSMVLWKKRSPEDGNEFAIGMLGMLFSGAMIIISSRFSVKFSGIKNEERNWSDHSYWVLYLIFFISILISIVLTGIDPDKSPIASVDTPISNIKNR